MTANNRYRIALLASCLGVLGSTCLGTANAANYWFDQNGTTAGFGTANGATYDWLGGTPWTTDGTGAFSPVGVAWPGASGVNHESFFIGAGANTNYTVRLGSSGSTTMYVRNIGVNVNSSTSGANGDGSVTIGNSGDSGVLTLSGSNSIGVQANGLLTINNPVNLQGFTANFRGGNATVNGLISGTGAVVLATGPTFGLNGGGTIRFANTANSYTGRTTIGQGFTLEATKLASAGTAHSLGNAISTASNIQIAGTLRYVGTGAQNTNRGMQFNGAGGTLEAAGATTADTINFNTVTGGITFDATAGNKVITLAGSNTGSNNTFGGVVGDAGAGSLTSITKVGSGRWNLTGTNTYTGDVTISAGTLAINNSQSLGLGPKSVFMQGTGRTLSLSNDITLASNISFFVSSTSADSGGIVSTSGVNEIRGPISITTGNAALNLSSNGTSRFLISGNVTQTASGRTLYLGGDSTDANTISGVIGQSVGSLPVQKQGNGKWVLSNSANSYTGNTTIKTGTLALSSSVSNNNIASSPVITVGDAAGSSGRLDVTGITATGGFQLASGQRLRGHGTVYGNVALQSGSILGPGTSAGTLSLVGDLSTLGGNNATIECEVIGTDPSPTADPAMPGVDFDVLAITGSLDITGGRLNVVVPGGSGSIRYYQQYKIITYTGTRTGAFGKLNDLVTGSGVYSNSHPNYRVYYNDAARDISIEFIPEPAGLSMIIPGLPLVARQRHRRQRTAR